MTTTVRVYGLGGWSDAEAWEIAGGLAATLRPDGWASVTHLASGIAVWCSKLDNTERPARAALGACLSMPVDWTREAETVKASLDADGVKELKRRIKIAVNPPRRQRYHAQHVRLQPYRAVHRRAALRERRDSGLVDILSVSDFETWRWNYERYASSFIIPPQRQPLTRFNRPPARLLLARRMAGRAHRATGSAYYGAVVHNRGLVWVEGRLSSRWPRRVAA